MSWTEGPKLRSHKATAFAAEEVARLWREQGDSALEAADECVRTLRNQMAEAHAQLAAYTADERGGARAHVILTLSKLRVAPSVPAERLMSAIRYVVPLEAWERPVWIAYAQRLGMDIDSRLPTAKIRDWADQWLQKLLARHLRGQPVEGLGVLW